MEGREKPHMGKYEEITNDWNYDASCILTSLVVWDLQGNGAVCQVKISPEILLVYRAHLVMVVYKILAADMRCKGVKKLPKVGTYTSNSRHCAST
jgi:hypothetical protein